MADMKRQVLLELLAKNKAMGQLLAFEQGIASVGRSVKRMASGLLVAAGVGGMGYMIKQQMSIIDTTAKLSARIGMSTESLIGLQHGANLAGIEQETLNKSLDVFSRKLGEVQLGSGQAKIALEKMGLSFENLINKSPDEALGLVADKISALSSQTEKAVAISYLFGESGQKLLNFFEAGSEGIEEFRKEADRLGLSFSMIDAAKVEAANDSLTRTKAVFTGLFRQAAIQLAPFVEAISTSFVNFATQGEGVGRNVAIAFQAITLSIAEAADQMASLVISIERLASPAETAKKNIEAIRQATLRYREITGEEKRLSPGQPSLFDKIYMQERVKLGIEPPESRVPGIEAWFRKIMSDAEGIEIKPVRFVSPLEGVDSEANKVTALVTDKAAAMARMYGQMGKITEDGYRARLVLIEQEKTVYSQAKIDELAIAQWQAEQVEKLDIEHLKFTGRLADGFKSAGMQIRREMTTWSERAAEFTFSMRDSLAGGLENMARDIDNWGDHFKNVLEEIYWSAMRIGIFQPAGAALASGISAGVGSLFGGGGTFENPQAVYGAPGVLGSRQSGGEIYQTGLYKLHAGENVIPPGGGAAKAPVIIFNNTGPPMQQKGEAQFDSEKVIINIESALNDRIQRRAGPLANTIKGLR